MMSSQCYESSTNPDSPRLSSRSLTPTDRAKVSLRYVCRNVAWVVAQECRSKASPTCVRLCVCVCSEVSLRSVNQKCCSEVSLRSVGQKCCSEVSIRRVSLRGVIKSGAQADPSLLRGVAQKCRSGVSLKSVSQSQLCSTRLVREVQVSSSSWKIATL